MHQGIPSLLNLSYTGPDKLPIIDLKDTNKLQFILRHLDSMYSEREGRMANSYPHIMMQTPNIRVNFKRDLSRICIIFAGLNNKPKQSVSYLTLQDLYWQARVAVWDGGPQRSIFIVNS